MKNSKNAHLVGKRIVLVQCNDTFIHLRPETMNNDTRTNFPPFMQVQCIGHVGFVLQTFTHSKNPSADLVQVELAYGSGPKATWRVLGVSPKFLTPFIGPLPG